MRPASWRWLKPLRNRSERMEVARLRCRAHAGTGIITGGAAPRLRLGSSSRTSGSVGSYVDRTELNQQAMIATDDFPRIYWGKSRGHRVVGVQSGYSLLTIELTTGEEVPTAETICGMKPVEVKVKMHKAVYFAGKSRK